MNYQPSDYNSLLPYWANFSYEKMCKCSKTPQKVKSSIQTKCQLHVTKTYKTKYFISAWRKDRFEFPREAKQVLKKSFLWTENADLLPRGKENCTSEAWKRLRVWRHSALSVSKRKQYGGAIRPRMEGKRLCRCHGVKIDNNVCL